MDLKLQLKRHKMILNTFYWKLPDQSSTDREQQFSNVLSLYAKIIRKTTILIIFRGEHKSTVGEITLPMYAA